MKQSTLLLLTMCACSGAPLQAQGERLEKPEAATPMPEATTPMPEAATPMPEAATPMPEAATPMPEAGAMPEAATLDAGKIDVCCRWGGWQPFIARCTLGDTGRTSFGCVGDDGGIEHDCRKCSVGQVCEGYQGDSGIPDAGYQSVITTCN
jgi:hypothetical protein